MRAAFAPIHAVICGVTASWLLGDIGCAAPEPRTPIGMSDAVPDAAPAAVAAVARVEWADFAAARAWPEAGPATLSLSHRRDGSLIHVLVEPSALAAYRELTVDAPMPDGARVMAWHEATNGAPLGGYLLEKHGGTWTALEIDGKGALVAGDRAACLRCHDMAPTDHLFGLRAAQPPTPALGEESIDPQRR